MTQRTSEALDAPDDHGTRVTTSSAVCSSVVNKLNAEGLTFAPDEPGKKTVFLYWSEIKGVKPCKKNYAQRQLDGRNKITDYAAVCVDALGGNYSFASKANVKIITTIRSRAALH